MDEVHVFAHGCVWIWLHTCVCMHRGVHVHLCKDGVAHVFVHRDLCGHKCANTNVSVQGGVCAFVQGLHKCVRACRCMCTWIYVAMGLHVRVHLDACKVCVWLCAHGCVPGCESVWGWCGVAHACAHAQICARMRRKCTGRGLHTCVPAHLLAHPQVYTWMRVHTCARLCNEYGCLHVCTCTWRHMHMCLCHDRLHTCVCVQLQALGSVQGCACTHMCSAGSHPWVFRGAGCCWGARGLHQPCTQGALHGRCVVHIALTWLCKVQSHCLHVCAMHCMALARCILHQAARAWCISSPLHKHNAVHGPCTAHIASRCL